MPDTKYAHPETLVETDWLSEHAKDPNVRVFEVDVDTTSYDQGHAAGAIGVNWKTDLQQQPVRDLLDKEQLEEFLSKNGVTKDTTIIVYGDNNNWFAAWFFWLLKYYGHKDAKLSRRRRSGSPRAALVTERGRSTQRVSAQDPMLRPRAARFGLEKARHGAKIIACGRQMNTRRAPRAENLPQEGAARGHPGAQKSHGRPRS